MHNNLPNFVRQQSKYDPNPHLIHSMLISETSVGLRNSREETVGYFYFDDSLYLNLDNYLYAKSLTILPYLGCVDIHIPDIFKLINYFVSKSYRLTRSDGYTHEQLHFTKVKVNG